MQKRQKILLLDDDQDILDLYREMLGALPSGPEVQTASSGARAIALLEAEPFDLLISDLKMPKMDGLQLLTIVRKRFPALKTIVMSALKDEQFKDRAYSMGIDQFLEKPRTGKEINYFCECIEGLLNKPQASGFRGVQSKSLMDIIQLETLSQSSSVLKITSGPVEGKIWIEGGEVIDAMAADAIGEEAFRMIASWKGGSFEVQAAEPGRSRTIHSSSHALLLETAQAMDEANLPAGARPKDAAPSGIQDKEPETPDKKLFEASRIPGIEFLVAVDRTKPKPPVAWGLDNPDEVGDLVNNVSNTFRGFSERLQWGDIKSIEGRGLHGKVAMLVHNDTTICAGWDRTIAWSQIRDGMKKVLARWLS